MSFDLENYKMRLRDPKVLIEMARELRKLPQEERYVHIQKVIARDSLIVMHLSNRCLSKKAMLAEIFQRGLATTDISTIKWWLGTAIPRLTVPEVADVLRTYAETQPEIIDNALYWLPGMLPKNDPKVAEELRRLRQSIKSFDVTSFEMEPAEREPETIAA